MASPAQIAANKLNSRKSTGPKSSEGRAISSMNSLKHGNRSRKLALLREESIAFEERLRKWMAIGDAQNDVEEYLVYRNVCLSFELDRAERARVERCTMLIENADEDEASEAETIGKQLFFDPAGPISLYGNPTLFSRKKNTSWNGQAVDPDDPAALVKSWKGVRRGAAGCGTSGRRCARSSSRRDSGSHTIGSRPFACWGVSRSRPTKIGASPRFSWPAMPWGQPARASFTTSKATWRTSSAAATGKPCASVGPICSAPGRKTSGNRCCSPWPIETSSASSAKLEVHEENADA